MENEGYTIQIRMVGDNQLQLTSNAPPGHFFSMLEAAKASFIRQLIENEAKNKGGLFVPPPGMNIR